MSLHQTPKSCRLSALVSFSLYAKGNNGTMNEVIGAHHEFHDEEFVAGWADRFVPTPERLELFNVILSELKSRIPPNGCVVELGIGPGYLADHLLRVMPEIQYYGVDFSSPMLDIARQRLRPHSARVAYVQADLVKDNWGRTSLRQLMPSFQPGRCMILVAKRTSKWSIRAARKYFKTAGCC